MDNREAVAAASEALASDQGAAGDAVKTEAPSSSGGDALFAELYGSDMASAVAAAVPQVEGGDDEDDDDDAGLESDEDAPEFVLGGEVGAPPGVSVGGSAVPGSHHRTLMRDGADEGGAPADVGVISMKKETVDEKPSLYELDLEQVEGKPWRNPGAKVSDWFNYGFNEDTWRVYCRKQTRMRDDNRMQNKIEVVTSGGYGGTMGGASGGAASAGGMGAARSSSRRSRSRSRSRDRRASPPPFMREDGRRRSRSRDTSRKRSRSRERTRGRSRERSRDDKRRR